MNKVVLFLALLTGLSGATAQTPAHTADQVGRTRSGYVPQQPVPSHGPEAGNPWIPVGPFGGDVTDLAADPQHPDVLFATAGYPFISTDGGENWSVLESLHSLAPNNVHTVAATDDGTLFATGLYTFGKVFRSTDGGASWHTRNIPVNSNGLCLAVDPNDSSTIYVGLASNVSLPTNQVIVRSTDAGNTWSAFDLTSVLPVGWNVVSISVDPDEDQTLFAVGNYSFSDAKIVASFDGGTTWEVRTGNLPAGVPYNAVAIAGQEVFVAGGQLFGSQYMGVYKSADWGVSWTNISASFPNKVSNDILIDETDVDRMYVATEGDGIYYTTDGGATWHYDATGAGSNGAARCIIQKPGTADQLYAGFLSLAVCQSSDAGLSWELSNTGIAALQVTDIEINPLNQEVILVSFEAENSGGCYLSTDAGESWSLVTGLPGTRYSQVTFGTDGDHYAWSNGPTTVAPEGLYKSTDNGVTWTNMGPDLGNLFETQIFALTTSATNPDLLFIGGNNFGVNGWASVIYKSQDGGTTWTNVYTGPEENFYSVRFLFLDPNAGDEVVYAGYKSEVEGGFLRSTDGGLTWLEIGSSIPGTFKWGGAIVCSPVSSSTLLAGCGGYGEPGTIFRSNDYGISWLSSNLHLANYSKISDILVHPAFPEVVYCASTQNGVQISTNGGVTWLPANEGLPGTNVTGFSSPYQTGGEWYGYASTYSNSNFRTLLFDPNVGAPEQGVSAGLLLFPNPSDGAVVIRVPGSSVIRRIDVTTLMGQPVPVYPDSSGSGQWIRVDAPPGLYIIKVYGADANYSGKLVIR